MAAMGMLLGLLAAIFWGTGDFLSRYMTQSLGSFRSLFFMQFIGIIGLGAYLLFTGEMQHILQSTSSLVWGWSLLAVVCNVASSYALYRAFESGTLTVVSPIVASYAAVTVMLSFLAGQVPTPIRDIGIVLVLVGVAGVATPLRWGSRVDAASGVMMQAQSDSVITARTQVFRGVGWALFSALGYGVTFWILGFRVTQNLGGLMPVWLIRTLTPCILLLCLPFTRQRFTLPRGSIWWIIVSVSIVDTLGYIAYTSGLLLQGQVAIITILSSLYSAVTIILAGLFLRERLQYTQWFSIFVILGGIVLVRI
ncbi:MAG TPA: DMT family transporter [Dictyobacter sp.]|jgi:drug/metabolite transporter (DMT)-like permease|nr:DMT family transporter [Dictyobacter sp.]